MFKLIRILQNNLKWLVAYVLLALVSKFLFTWQNIAIPFWPAAGLAIAAISVNGLTLIPALVLGNFISSGCTLQLHCDFSPGSPIVALAAAAQATLIGSWVSRGDALNWHVERPLELFRTLLVIGPLGNWPAALSYYVISSMGGLSYSGNLTSALLWWIGDSVGSLIVFPTVLLLLPNGPPRWKLRKSFLSLPLFLIFLIPCLVSLVAQDLFLSAVGHSVDQVFLEAGTQKIQLLLAVSQFIAVFLGLGVVLQASTIDQARKEEIIRSKYASLAAAAVIHEIAQPMLRLRLGLDLIKQVSNDLGLICTNALVISQINDVITRFDTEIDAISVVSQSIHDLTISGIRDSTTANINLAIDRVVAQMRILLDERDQVLKIQVPSEFPAVGVGQIQLQSALRNLLSNASLAAADQGVIYLSVQLLDHVCEITVQDSGSGFSGEELDLGRKPSLSTFNGMGIGLMIVRRLVDEAGGSIVFCRSEALGGACVQMKLPIMVA